MRRLIILVFLAVLWHSLLGQEQWLEQLTQKYGIPGLQLVCLKGDKEQVANIGFYRKSSGKRVTSRTIFEAASLSKCVFAYAVLRLIDRGILSLDTPLVKYVGSYDRFDPADPRYARITARMVLRHTTGLPNWGDKYASLIFSPDSTYSYSGEGFQYLQCVAEKLTGKTLNKIAQQEVFTPLGMANSSYSWSERFDSLSSFGNDTASINNHKHQMAASSLLTCAEDYAIFLRALIAGKGLKPETHRMMFEKQSAGIWFKHRVTEASDHIWWGLGIGLQENETGRWGWQWGDNGDFKGFCIVNPDKKEALVYFTHSNWGLHITTEILNAYLGKQTWWPPLWNGYEFWGKASMEAFWAELEKKGYSHAAEIAVQIKQKDTSFALPESDVNDLAFILLGKGRKNNAIEIFKYNLLVHPASADAYEGLAEGYEDAGQKELALENFRKSKELNPGNNYAADHIRKLESEIK